MTSGRYAVAKRVMDLTIAVPVALVTLPLMLILAAASAIAYRSNPFFTQPRLGLDCKEFTFVKIRSLPTSAPKAADKFEIGELRNHGFGRFVRKLHLDELPQLWLVIGGTMSLVGPRPEMPELAETFDSVFVKERCTVKPGCTGLWQIATSSAGLIGDSPEYDLHYVNHSTLRLDLWTLLFTAKEILGAPSIEDLDAIPAWTGAAPARVAVLSD